MLVVALDYFPSPADPRTQKTHPHLTNQKVLTAKRRIRDFVNSRLQPDQRCNAIHSSDNEEGALEYIRLAMPEEKEFICSKVESLATLIESRHTVRARFSTGGRRAKVELVEYDSRLAVKKTYRPGCERFLERELLMMRKIGVELSEVPELIEAGSNYFICPNYDDVLRYDPNSRRLLPLKVVRQAFGFLKQVYDRGYSLIDFSPENLLVDRESGLKVIDFEFLYKYDVLPGDFSRCYELAGIPENFSADLPKAYYLHAPYEYLWRWRVGLTYSSLLNDPLWLQHLKRTAFRFRSALPFNAGKLYRSVLAWRRRRLAQ